LNIPATLGDCLSQSAMLFAVLMTRMEDDKMKQKNFRALVEEIAGIANVAELTRVGNHAQVDVDGVSFTLMEGVELEEGTAAYFCDFGAVPTNADRAEILQRLLECNLLMFGVGTPTFSLNFETGHVLLMGRVEFEKIEAKSLLSAFAQFSAQAKLWRQTYFMEGMKKTRAKTHRLLAAAETP